DDIVDNGFKPPIPECRVTTIATTEALTSAIPTEQDVTTEPTTTDLAVIGVVSGLLGLVIIILVVVIIFMNMRQKKSPTRNNRTEQNNNLPAVSNNPSQSGPIIENVYQNEVHVYQNEVNAHHNEVNQYQNEVNICPNEVHVYQNDVNQTEPVIHHMGEKSKDSSNIRDHDEKPLNTKHEGPQYKANPTTAQVRRSELYTKVDLKNKPKQSNAIKTTHDTLDKESTGKDNPMYQHQELQNDRACLQGLTSGHPKLKSNSIYFASDDDYSLETC
ncbi:unnamed protein product, partial [Owenia fusiformis]